MVFTKIKVIFCNIIENIDVRTSILIKRIKTEMGRMIADKKYELIKIFIEDYKNST